MMLIFISMMTTILLVIVVLLIIKQMITVRRMIMVIEIITNAVIVLIDDRCIIDNKTDSNDCENSKGKNKALLTIILTEKEQNSTLTPLLPGLERRLEGQVPDRLRGANGDPLPSSPRRLPANGLRPAQPGVWLRGRARLLQVGASNSRASPRCASGLRSRLCHRWTPPATLARPPSPRASGAHVAGPRGAGDGWAWNVLKEGLRDQKKDPKDLEALKTKRKVLPRILARSPPSQRAPPQPRKPQPVDR